MADCLYQYAVPVMSETGAWRNGHGPCLQRPDGSGPPVRKRLRVWPHQAARHRRRGEAGDVYLVTAIGIPGCSVGSAVSSGPGQLLGNQFIENPFLMAVSSLAPMCRATRASAADCTVLSKSCRLFGSTFAALWQAADPC